MQQSNRNKLEQYRPKLKEWLNDQTCHLDLQGKQDILDVIRAEWNPGYHCDMFCGKCVVNMLEYAFRCLDSDKTDTITVNL